MASLSGPLYPYGSYFERNYREGERIEVRDLPDWDWDDDWGDNERIDKLTVKGLRKELKQLDLATSGKKAELVTRLRDAKRKKRIDNTPKRVRVPSDWISWKNHRLKKRGFYDSENNRHHDVDKAPPRIVLREESYSSKLNIPLKKPEPDFPSSGHLEFKTWLQHKVEQVAQGRASPKFLHTQGRADEEQQARDKWDELTEMIRGILNEDLLKPQQPGQSLSDEVNHILLMLKIIGRKAGVFTHTKTETDPNFIQSLDAYHMRKELPRKLTPEQYIRFQLVQRQPNFLDSICRQIVKVLIAESKTTSPSGGRSASNRNNRKIYRWLSLSLHGTKEFLRHAKKNGIDVTDDEVKAEIESNPEFFSKKEKFDNNRFIGWLERKNKNHKLHSEKVVQLKELLKGRGLKTTGNKVVLLSRLFVAEHLDHTRFELTIQGLELKQIDPPDDWQYAEVETAAVIFVEILSKEVERVILESIEEVEKIVMNPKDPCKIRDKKVGLTDSEKKELESLLGLKWDANKNQYGPVEGEGGCFGNWNFNKGKRWSSEDASRQNIKKTINSIIVNLQERELIKFEGMNKEEYQQHFTSSNKKNHPSRGLKADAHVIHFTKKLFGIIGKSEYTDFKAKKEHAIYRFLRGARDRWMYSPPQSHKRILQGLCAHCLNCNKNKKDCKCEEHDYDRCKIHVMNHHDGLWPTWRTTESHEYDGITRDDKGQWKGGGFLVEQLRSITNRRHSPFDELGTPRVVANEEAIDALNTLQETQWEINLHLLDALFETKHEMGQTAGLIANVRPKQIFRSAFYGKEDDFSYAVDYEEFKRSRAEILNWIKKIINHNANVFWHAWELDFRGRLYPKCTTLSPVTSDLSRAMIRFKHWKPLGNKPEDRTGIDWIHIHVHNMMEGVDDADGDSLWKRDEKAMKKQTFKTRIKWVEENLDQLRQMAKFPKIHRETLRLDKRRPGKDEIYQRLAALLELDRAYTEYEANGEDWSEVYSGQPVYLDATCNGYQHASTVLRNRKLAELVNVVGDSGQRPNDLYAVVAKTAKDKSAGGTKKKTVAQLKALAKKHELPRYSKLKRAELVDALYDAIPLMRSAEMVRAELESFLDEDQVDIAIKRIFNRNVAKQPTMISAYGATKSGLRKCFHGRGQDGPAAFWESKKTSKEREADEKSLKGLEKKKKIPEKYREVCRRMNDSSMDPYQSRRLNRQLLAMKKDKNLSDTQYKNYNKFLKETKSLEVWNEGSSLRLAILEKDDELHGSQPTSTKREGFNIDLKRHIRPKQPLKPKLSKFLDIRARRQNKLTTLVCEAYYDAIEEVTGRAFDTLGQDLTSVANDGIGYTNLLEVTDAMNFDRESNGEPPLTTEQEEGAAAIFKKHDVDEDNFLYIDELASFFTSLKEAKSLSGMAETIKRWEETLNEYNDERIDKLTVKGLRKELKQLDLATSGKKAELVTRLRDAKPFRFTIDKDNPSIGKKKAPKATQSKGDGLWPGVQWHLPQDEKKGFQVNNYYMKSRDPSTTREKNPFRPESVFSALLPKWYTATNSPFKGEKTDKRSLPRVKQSLEDEWGSIPEVRQKLDEMESLSRKKLQPILEIISQQGKNKQSNKKRLNEIMKILDHKNISTTNYEDEEWRRIEHSTAPKGMEGHNNDFIEDFVGNVRADAEEPWTKDDNKEAEKKAKEEYRKGQLPGSLKDWITNHHILHRKLLPNFIQSLDAYHMRKTINQCKDKIEDLSFWAVHDAFGTHACDVGTMVGIVRSNFYDIHDSLKFGGWHEPMSESLELKDIKNSEYLIN